MRIRVYNDITDTLDLDVSLFIEKENLSFSTTILKPDKESRVNPNKQTTKLSFSNLKNRIDSGGFARWSFHLDNTGFHKFFNLYERVAESKIQPPEYCKQNNINFVLHVIVRPEDISFEDCIYFVNMTEKSKFECNQKWDFHDRFIPDPVNPHEKPYFPEISLSKEIINGKIYINIKTPETVNENYYIKSDNGFVPAKVKVTNGVGKFIFTPISMEDGDIAKVKVGLKFVSNIASIDVVA
jgi:hypothetical protein